MWKTLKGFSVVCVDVCLQSHTPETNNNKMRTREVSRQPTWKTLKGFSVVCVYVCLQSHAPETEEEKSSERKRKEEGKRKGWKKKEIRKKSTTIKWLVVSCVQICFLLLW